MFTEKKKSEKKLRIMDEGPTVKKKGENV